MADWNGIFQALKQNEPQIYSKILPFKYKLQTIAYDEIESKSDFEFLSVEQRGITDSRYLSKQRFLNIDHENLNLINVRFFLYCFIGLSQLFDGNGYTKNSNGTIGCKEYLIPNLKLNEIDKLKVIQMNVSLPQTISYK